MISVLVLIQKENVQSLHDGNFVSKVYCIKSDCFMLSLSFIQEWTHFNKFMDEFLNLIEDVLLLSGNLLLLGDFNIHMEKPHIPETQAFIQLIDSIGLQQHVHHPMHQNGHTLDIIFHGLKRHPLRSRSRIVFY